jgi:hypothetical protein
MGIKDSVKSAKSYPISLSTIGKGVKNIDKAIQKN